jgi:hypothetical protein
MQEKKGKEWKGENAIAVPEYCQRRAKREERRERERERKERTGVKLAVHANVPMIKPVTYILDRRDTHFAANAPTRSRT